MTICKAQLKHPVIIVSACFGFRIGCIWVFPCRIRCASVRSERSGFCPADDYPARLLSCGHVFACIRICFDSVPVRRSVLVSGVHSSRWACSPDVLFIFCRASGNTGCTFRYISMVSGYWLIYAASCGPVLLGITADSRKLLHSVRKYNAM